uniref:Ovule protein n=1 Tax=Brugia timori TaxID=42155 RepID=A0A0R3QLW2_9BILA
LWSRESKVKREEALSISLQRSSMTADVIDATANFTLEDCKSSKNRTTSRRICKSRQ